MKHRNPKTRRTTDDKTIARIRALRAQGLSAAIIAQRISVSISTVYEYLKPSPKVNT